MSLHTLFTITKVLCDYVLGVHMLSVLVPMLVSYLIEPEHEKLTTAISLKLHQVALQKLMQIGPLYPTHFRTIMQSSNDLRNRIETAIKAQQNPTAAQQHSSKKSAVDGSKTSAIPSKPSITLKTNFGNFTG